jgi:ribosomal protein S18 acetylase RimI-like enzyme
MSDITIHQALIALPAPRVGISIRAATMADLPFMDRLQKANSRALGYFPTKQFEGYIAMGGVLVAESAGNGQLAAGSEDAPSLPTARCPLPTYSPLGYIISRDRYLKRDELGVIYQLCVTPGEQRKLVGAALVQAVFERAAYGCRLFCCWCAQDLAANRFWEAMGFVPVAFRTGSTKKGQVSRGKGQVEENTSATGPLPLNTCPSRSRVHIFWQKRIRRGDTATPWWFPSKTESGALRADRIVLPIPPGVRWEDVRPWEDEGLRTNGLGLSEEKAKPARRSKASTKSLVLSPKSSRVPVQFGRPGAVMPVAETPAAAAEIVKTPRPKRATPKVDPKLVQAARELRDRWLEQVNAGQYDLPSAAKYDIGRLPSPPCRQVPEETTPMLPAA